MSTARVEQLPVALHDDQCYRAVQSRDSRFDGWFVIAVHTTGIYCRPSCPATTPKRQNVSFFSTSATAQQRGFRACKRCRPDASPGSPEWNIRADVVARAMRLIADGVIDRDGVSGLARRLGYSERHLNRLLTDELGAGPLAIARAQRAQTARVLIETTTMSMTDIAFAAGFASVRQFNDTVREVFATAPTDLRTQRRQRERRATAAVAADAGAGSITLRLPVRAALRRTVGARVPGARVVPGVEVVGRRPCTDDRSGCPTAPVSCRCGRSTTRSPARCGSTASPICPPRSNGAAACSISMPTRSPSIATSAPTRLLAPLVAARPGLRSPGCVDGAELLVRAIIGQQVSVAGAATVAGRLAALVADGAGRLPGGATDLQLLFPSAASLAELDPEQLPMPRARGRTLAARVRGDRRRAARRRSRRRPRAAVHRSCSSCPASGRGRRSTS